MTITTRILSLSRRSIIHCAL